MKSAQRPGERKRGAGRGTGRVLILLAAGAGLPVQAATNTLIDTSFTAAEGYVEGSALDGQASWQSPGYAIFPAFEITDAAGAGYADFGPVADDGLLDITFGNDVQWANAVSNNVGDEWSGSLTFQLEAPATPGQEVTRSIEVVDENGAPVGVYSNTFTVAALAGAELFRIGLTADSFGELSHTDAADVILYVRCQTSGRLDFQFNSAANLERRLAFLTNVDAGWDPNWANGGNDATNGPDFVTEPITFNWTLRKATFPTNVYTAVGEVIVGTNVYSEGKVAAYDGATNAYAASSLTFAMGTHPETTRGLDVVSGLEIVATPRRMAIDELVLVEATGQPPALIAPDNLVAEVGDGTVTLAWFEAVEATSYTVRRYDAPANGTAVVLASGLTDLTYTDSGLTNGVTYFYTVAADYGSFGEGETDRLAARPLAKTTVVDWGPSPDIVVGVGNAGNADWEVTTAEVNGLLNHVGAATNGALWTAGTGTYDTGLVPSLYGVAQLANGVWAQRHVRNDVLLTDGRTMDLIRVRTRGGSGDTPNGMYSALIYAQAEDFAGGAPVDVTGSTTYAFETYNDDWTEEIGFGALRTAIRNGTQWYVSETVHTDTGATVIPDLKAERWARLTPADLNSATQMTVNGATFETVPGLTDVNAIGFFCDHIRSVYMVSWRLVAGDVATPFQLWTDSYGIYNEDAAPDYDYDGDGVDNLYEWGAVGVPTDPASTGRVPRAPVLDAAGQNLVYVYPIRADEPRPTYIVEEATDLAAGDWTDRQDTYTILPPGEWSTNTTAVLAVTNLVPAQLEQKFLRLRITE